MAANNRYRHRVGSRVQVTEGAGIDSRRVGTVVPRSVLKTDGSGIPRNVQGAYTKVSEYDWTRYRVVKYDNGEITIMPVNYLRSKIENPKV